MENSALVLGKRGYKPSLKKIKLFSFDKSFNGFTLWFWRKKRKDSTWYHSRSFSFGNYRKYWSKNGTGKQWGYRTNGALKSRKEDNCFDCTLSLGYITFGYTNWDYGS